MMPEIVSFERRRYPRFNIDLPVRYNKVDSSIGYNGRAMNVSEGGLLICSPERIGINQHLKSKLFFILGSELDTVETETQVVWTDFYLNKAWGDYRSGIRFTDISTNDMTKLKMFMKNLS
ncbi:MAG: PilZ domain-containing protein [Thermodesulfobacteriota bacterium]